MRRYSEIWEVSIVLDYFRTMKLAQELSLKDLSLKLTMLLHLTTGQRSQSVHLFDINHIQAVGDMYRITVMDKLKQSKPGKHPEPIELLAFKEDKKLCVVEHLTEYLSRTKPLRKEHSQLLLTYIKPHDPILRDTVSRWTKAVMKSAGIDITAYSAHSTRSASTSSCKAKGLAIQEILKAAGWLNSGTFARFYEKPVDRAANFGHTLLE